MRRLVTAIVLVLLATAARSNNLYPEWVQANSVAIYDISQIVTGDFNHDGRVDIAGRTSAHVIGVMLTHGDGSLGAWTPIYQADYLTQIEVADVDGNGILDIVASDIATNRILVLLGNGDGTFQDPIATDLTTSPTGFVTADFDGDQKLDIVFRSYSSATLTIAKGDGAGHFAEVAQIPADGGPTQMAAGDFDSDGYTDVALLIGNPAQYEIFFGNSSATFGSPFLIAGPASGSLRIRAVDLDGDGRLDLVSCEYYAETITVVANNGARSFASPVAYNAFANAPYQYGGAFDFIVADVNGDNLPDVVVAMANERTLATLRGLGNGLLDHPVITFTLNQFPTTIVSGDFSGTGRTDIAVRMPASYSATNVTLLTNAAGVAVVTVTSRSPVISAGQTATLTTTISTAASNGYYPDGSPYPTGNITFRAGDTILGTAPLANRTATIDVPSLPVGEYSITASFAGDDSYLPADSAAITQKVVNEHTTITLTSNQAPGVPIPFGTSIIFQASATSEIPGPVQGTFWLYMDGARSQYSVGLDYIYVYSLTPGTHTFWIQYDGSATQPPATSNVVTQVVVKAQSVVSIDLVPYPVINSMNPQLRVSLSGNPFGGVPGGNVHLYEGLTLLGTTFADNRCCSGGMSVYMPIPPLNPGIHYLYATYDGDSNFEPGHSKPQKAYVMASTTTFQLQTSTYYGNLSVGGYFTLPAGGHFTIERRVGSGPWALWVSYALYANYTEYSPQPGAVYAFRMHAYDASNQLLADSDTAVTTLVAFTDDPLTIDAFVRSVHVQELIAAANTLRSSVGLSAISAPDAVAGGVPRASDLAPIFGAVSEARALYGASAVPLPADLATGQAIRMHHIQDLREALH